MDGISDEEGRRLTYNPTYKTTPFTDFDAVTPDTSLESLNLNWREKDLPERLRTKHVHRLHSYLGKFVPQLVEIFLRKYSPRRVIDPFCGSGTTMVEASVLGIDSVGCDISTFNCLMSKVKTDTYNVEKLGGEIKHILRRMKAKVSYDPLFKDVPDTDNEYLGKWFATRSRKQLLYFRSLIPDYMHQDLFSLILSRAARSSRLTTHYDLDFPKKPQAEPYQCHKHRKICKPTDNALQFLRRYCLDSLRRIKEFMKIRSGAAVDIINDDARTADFPETDMVFTSPPYVGLIDYHRQHEYAYELLDIEEREESEIGPAFRGTSKKAQREYITGIGDVFSKIKDSLLDEGVIAIVVNDKHDLFNGLASEIGFTQESSVERHVNRRTGRRANDFYEEVLVWRKA